MRKVSKIICILSLIILSMFFIKNKHQNEIYQEETKKNKFLTLMLEKEAGTGRYEESSNDFPKEGYYFNEKLSKCERGSKLSYDTETKKLKVTAIGSDKCYVYLDQDKLGSICRGQNMVECFIKNYKKDETIYYHDENLAGGAEDFSYRYTGSFEEVNNFICFDNGATSEGECSDDSDLYRIIGLFKKNENNYEMKLIKYDFTTSEQSGDNGAYKAIYSYADSRNSYKGNKENFANIGGYYWSGSGKQINDWKNSELRKTNLNGYYLNTYLKEIKHIDIDNLIETHIWKLNGYNSYKTIPKVMYDNEMNKVDSSTGELSTIEDKIGLMYVSDYGYAASPSSTNNWTTEFGSYSTNTIPDNNWMFMGLHEWTITRPAVNSYTVFYIHIYGNVYADYNYDIALGVRPSFYLATDVKVQSGSGSKTNPYRITNSQN